MNQSTVFVASVLGGFMLYLAANGRFPVYLATIWPRPTGVQAGATAQPNLAESAISTLGKIGAGLAQFIP